VLTLAPGADCAASAGVCLITESLDGSLRASKGYDQVTGIGAATSRLVAAIGRYLSTYAGAQSRRRR